jgi:hypothetical protein
MHSTIHALRIAVGASAVVACGLVMSACGNEQAVDPDPATVVGQITAPSSTPTCSYTADQMQRRMDAGKPAGCGTDTDAGTGHPGFAHANDNHHPAMF